MPDFKPTPLHYAALKNNCDYLKNNTVTSEELLDTTWIGNTPLLWGIANSSVSFVLALLEFSDTTQVNVKSTNYLNTPLIFSVSKGWTHVATEGIESNPQKAIALKLLQKRAEVNAVDGYGRTALHYACLHRNIEAITALVNAGALWDTKDKNNQSPLDFCCVDYDTASKQLEDATGGSRGYTFTLVEDNFDSCCIFYQSLSKLLALDNKSVEVSLLKQAYEMNQKINDALAPIFNHARKLFDQYITNYPFKLYAKNIMHADSLNHNIIKLPNSREGRKIQSLLKIYVELKNASSVCIDFSHNKITSNIKKEEIEQILNNGLENPDLMAERNLIIKVGMVILNLFSFLCAGLPLFANYWMTNQVFFSHQTQTEKILSQCKDEMASRGKELSHKCPIM